MDSVILKVPNYGITRQYVISFVNAMDKDKVEIQIQGNSIRIQSKSASLPKIFAEVFYEAERRLRDYTERKSGKDVVDGNDSKQDKGDKKPRMDIPASGNDKEILLKVKKDLKMPIDASFVEVFHQFGEYLERMDAKDFQSVANGPKLHSPLSIFKPELYGYTRGPYFDGELKSEEVSQEEAKISTWEFLIRLAGYAISRVGIIAIPSGDNGECS